MLPAIPTKLSQIDETTIGQHYLLHPTDVCYHIWEYTRRGGFSAGPTNSLISNLKKKLSHASTHPCELRWKEQAIGHCGEALRRLLNRRWIEEHGTLIPIPCSKIAGHPDHDRRLLRVLATACHGLKADIRPLLVQSASTAADHENAQRRRFEELLAITHIDEAMAGEGVRSQLVVFDDVLNSGKHFKVAQRLLRQRFPVTPILGLFLARCVPDGRLHTQ